MRISNLEIQDFRNHKKTFLIFDHINFIGGDNNAGKSTIKGALQFALTGENEWTPGGKNAKNLIRHGEQEAFVEAEIEGLGTVKRVITQKGTSVELNSNKIPDRELEKEYLDLFGVGYDYISCMFDAGKFLNMKPNEQKDFIFRLTQATLDIQKVIDFMDNPSAEAVDAVRSILQNSGGQITVDTLDAVYNEFYTARKLAKKELADIEAKLKVLGGCTANPGIDIVKVETELEQVKARREELLQRIALIDERAKQVRRIRDYIANIEQKITSIESKINPNLNVADAEEEIVKLKDEINQTEKEIEKKKAVINVLVGQNKSLQSMLAKLNTTRCPLSDKLVCNTDKSMLIAELQKQLDANNETVRELEKEAGDLELKLKEAEERKEQMETALRLSAELEELKQQKETLQKDLASIEIEDATVLNDELNKLDIIYKDLSAQQRLYQEWERQKEEYEKTEKALTQAKKKVEIYEYLVKEFSPKGVKARILQKIITPIENYCNDKLKTLTNNRYSLKFNINDGFEVLVQNHNGTVGIDNLSTSEKLRIGIIFQDAINSLTGVRMLFIDDAEILDTKNFALLMELIDSVKDNYDNIFITLTCDSLFLQGQKGKGKKAFFVENGEVREV